KRVPPHHAVPRTLGEFLRDHPQHVPGGNPFFLNFVCQRLVAEGHLVAAGLGEGSPPLSAAYYNWQFNGMALNYGAYDFLVFGFPCIYEHFRESVLPVEVVYGGQPDIGTGFLLEDHRIATAAHCISGMDYLEIP